jgi:hypothetical protein
MVESACTFRIVMLLCTQTCIDNLGCCITRFMLNKRIQRVLASFTGNPRMSVLIIARIFLSINHWCLIYKHKVLPAIYWLAWFSDNA